MAQQQFGQSPQTSPGQFNSDEFPDLPFPFSPCDALGSSSPQINNKEDDGYGGSYDGSYFDGYALSQPSSLCSPDAFLPNTNAHLDSTLGAGDALPYPDGFIDFGSAPCDFSLDGIPSHCTSSPGLIAPATAASSYNSSFDFNFSNEGGMHEPAIGDEAGNVAGIQVSSSGSPHQSFWSDSVFANAGFPDLPLPVYCSGGAGGFSNYFLHTDPAPQMQPSQDSMDANADSGCRTIPTLLNVSHPTAYTFNQHSANILGRPGFLQPDTVDPNAVHPPLTLRSIRSPLSSSAPSPLLSNRGVAAFEAAPSSIGSTLSHIMPVTQANQVPSNGGTGENGENGADAPPRPRRELPMKPRKKLPSPPTKIRTKLPAAPARASATASVQPSPASSKDGHQRTSLPTIKRLGRRGDKGPAKGPERAHSGKRSATGRRSAASSKVDADSPTSNSNEEDASQDEGYRIKTDAELTRVGTDSHHSRNFKPLNRRHASPVDNEAMSQDENASSSLSSPVSKASSLDPPRRKPLTPAKRASPSKETLPRKRKSQVGRPSLDMSTAANADAGSNDELSKSRLRSDELLVRCRDQGMTYKDIKKIHGFTEAESTLRGRVRAAIKSKDMRVRKPVWQRIDDDLLRKGVAKLSDRNGKVPWKSVAEYIENNGGSYCFGYATCHKRWEALVGAESQGLDRPEDAEDQEDDDDQEGDDSEEEEDDDDEE